MSLAMVADILFAATALAMMLASEFMSEQAATATVLTVLAATAIQLVVLSART
jgi:hypothetical protein